jgi:hypothetical protein
MAVPDAITPEPRIGTHGICQQEHTARTGDPFRCQFPIKRDWDIDVDTFMTINENWVLHLTPNIPYLNEAGLVQLG